MMYTTRIKDHFKEKIQTFFWNDSDNDEFVALMTMDHMTLLWSPETNLIVDIFNNKIDTFKVIPDGSVEIKVEAKTEEYADRYAIHGTYFVTGYSSMGEGRPMLLHIQKDGSNKIMKMLPSRLSVVSVKDKE